MSRLISSGAYGCIYHPPYDCKGKDLKDTSLITKLVENDFSTSNEYHISRLLKDVPGFLSIEKKCIVSSTIVKKHMQCELLKGRDKDKDPSHEKEYVLLYSPYINGVQLIDYLKNDFTVEKLLKSLSVLCNRIETLIDHHIIHHDLHFGNIMYDTDFIVIDFGLAISSDRFFLNKQLNFPYLKKAIFRYTPTWGYFSIDEHLLGHLIHRGMITVDIIKNTIYKYLSNHIIKLVSSEFYNQYIETSINYYKKLVLIPKDVLIKRFLSYWKTWDYFKIALHFIKIYINLKIEFPELLMFLLLMIHPIPTYRPSVLEVNKNLQILIKSYSSKINYVTQFTNDLTKELSMSHIDT